MKKFNSLICAGVLAVVGLVGVCDKVFAADSNVTQNKIETNWTKGTSFLLWNAYSGWGASEFFSGSSTANGGTTSVTAGLINVSHLSGTKYISLYGSPTTTTGTVTYKVYGWYGTTTLINATGTRGARLLNETTFSFTSAIGTSSLISETSNPLMMAVSVLPSSGSITSTVGLTSITAR